MTIDHCQHGRKGTARTALLGAVLLAHCLGAPLAALAQQSPSSFGMDILRGALGEEASTQRQPAQVPRTTLEPDAGPLAQVTLVALLIEDGARIEQGLTWRIYSGKGAGPDGKPRLVATFRDAAPVAKLSAGDYYVNVAYGRANATRKISLVANMQSEEKFALNVGLLRVTALLGNRPLPPTGGATFDVYTEERDQLGQRNKLVSAARPGTMLRLNSGLYQIVSQYGDANSTVSADLTVEPGKLTEATVVHQAARISFKLVTRSGGEALADTQWSILNRQGDIVKESAGALPQHMLAPGAYTVSARSQGRTFRRSFNVRAGENAEVEVLMQPQ